MKIKFDIEAIAAGYGIPLEDYRKSLNGSNLSGITEARVATLLTEYGGKCMGNEQLPYDVVAPDRLLEKIEIRSIFNSAPSFAPSTATGKGRFFHEPDLYETVKTVGFCKTKRREDVDYYMSNNASMTQKRFFERFPYEEYAFVA